MKITFTGDNGPLDGLIRQLIETAGGVNRPEYVREMIIAALKAGREDEQRADLKIMNTTLKEMRFTSRVFGRYRGVRKVTVFGSARTRTDEPIYRMAERFGRLIADAGYMVITGGGGGIMAAVDAGAGPEHAFRVNIRLPFEERHDPVRPDDPRSITYKYFFNRKVAFLKEADGVALFPGGFGTLDEAMETLTLLQTGKRNPMPLLLVDDPDAPYWPPVINLFRRELLTRRYICPTDFSLFERVCSPEEALEKIRRFYRRYHSSRYVRGRLVIRLLSQPGSGEVRELAERFSDLLLPGGGFTPSGPLEEEADDPEAIALPRLVVDFNRRDFGRLKEMIDFINGF